jgi:ABC-2 type transport system ATP-binding protein
MQTLGEVKDLLQKKDVTNIATRGLSDIQIEEVRQFLQRMGVDPAIEHPTTTLEDLFIRIVREQTPAGQSSVGSGPT